MKFNNDWQEDVILKQTSQQTNKWSNRDFETLSLAKNRLTPRHFRVKKRDCETHITAKKTRLQDSWNSTKILRDPEFLKDHSPPLTKVSWVRFPDPASHMGWVCCWSSSLLREVFPRVFRFSLLENQYFQIPIRSGSLSFSFFFYFILCTFMHLHTPS